MDLLCFNDLEEFNNNTQFYSRGYESELYRYTYGDKEILFKKYFEQSQINIDKINKISTLTTEGLIKPKRLLKIGDNIEGFGMDFKRGLYPLSVEKKDLSNSQKYNLIISLKRILSSLKEEGCLYGDLNLGNIITNGNEVYLCDSVNVKIDSFNFDETSSTMRKYIERTGTTDGIDSYMLNLLTVYLFNEIEYDSIIESIEMEIMNMFNKQLLNDIVGVTDSMDSLNMCYDIFLSDQVCDKLLIDYIDIDKINKCDKVSKM